MTTYYTVSGVPTAHSFGSSAYIRTEYTSIQTAFGTVNTEMITKGAIAGQAWTGAHTFTGGSIAVTTQSQGDNSTKAASTAYADAIKTYGTATWAPIASPTFTGTVTIPAGASIDGFALLASPALTGVPTAPTASVGVATTQIATTAFVSATSFTAALPGQTANNGKFLQTDGTNPTWQLAIPDQTSASGKFLTSNGSAASWAVVPAATGSIIYLAQVAGAI